MAGFKNKITKFIFMVILVLVCANLYTIIPTKKKKMMKKVQFTQLQTIRNAYQNGKAYMSSIFSGSPEHSKWDSMKCSEIDRTHMTPKLKPRSAQSNVPAEFYHLNWTNNMLDDYKVLKLPRQDICDVGEDEKLLLLLIISDKSSGHMRRSIRETFGSVKKIATWQIRTVLIYGDELNQTLSNVLNETDLLVGNFADGYNNMTQKVAFGFKWIQLYCPRANFVFRLTQDTFINLTKVVHFLDDKLKQNVTRLYHGVPVSGANIFHTGKSKLLSPVKWKTQYPTFISGCGIIFSQSVIQDMNFLFCKVPLCFPDDTYIGALMEVLGVSPTGSWQYHFQLFPRHQKILKQDVTKADGVVPSDSTLVHFFKLSDPVNVQKILWNSFSNTAPEGIEFHSL